MTNKKVLRKMKCQSEVLPMIKSGKLKYFDHIIGNKKYTDFFKIFSREKFKIRKPLEKEWSSGLQAHANRLGQHQTELFYTAAYKISIALKNGTSRPKKNFFNYFLYILMRSLSFSVRVFDLYLIKLTCFSLHEESERIVLVSILLSYHYSIICYNVVFSYYFPKEQ